jgi:hypothetical protein
MKVALGVILFELRRQTGRGLWRALTDTIERY